MKHDKPIMLIEDDEVDAMTVKRALGDLKVSNPLVRVANGQQALEYLQQDSNPKPCVILLDLNMPVMNGHEFLQQVKADKNLQVIPVVVLTTSTEQTDIQMGFRHGAAGYIIKPVDYKKFVESMKVIDIYWTLSRLPSGVEFYESEKIQSSVT